MFLSNPRKSFGLLLICAITLQGCGSSQTNENTEITLEADVESRFSFPTREPEVYQAEVMLASGANADRWFVARRGDKWRLDIFRGDEKVTTRLRNGGLFTINHEKRTYTVTIEGSGPGGAINEDAVLFFRGVDYLDYEEVSSDSTVVTYKSRPHRPTADKVLITVDKTSGMILMQEFLDADGNPGGVFYELRNLKLDVDDAAFGLPEGYRKVLK